MNTGSILLAVGCLVLAPAISVASDSLRTVALSDSPAPDGADSYNYFENPVLNNRGDVAFRAGTTTNTFGVVRQRADGSTTWAARIGAPAPGVDGTFQELYGPAIDFDGRVSFLDFTTGPDRGGVWREDGFGNIEPIAIASDGVTAPGTAGEFAHFDTRVLFNSFGEAGFATGIRSDKFPDTGAWTETAQEGLRLIARTGDPAPGTEGMFEYISFLLTSISNNGHAAITPTLMGDSLSELNNSGLWVSEPDGLLRLVVQEGDPVPDSNQQFFSPYQVQINRLGHTAFFASVRDEGTDGVSGGGVFRERGSGLETVLRIGDPLPGTNASIRSVDSRILQNTTGVLAFTAYLEGSGVNASNDDILLTEDGSGNLSIVAREGEPAPGTDALFQWDSFSQNTYFYESINAYGEVAFYSYLAGPNVDESNDRGLWATRDGELQLIVREGDQLDVSGDATVVDLRTVSDLDFVSGSGNDDGYRSAFNDRGQIAFTASFTDGSRGVFISDLVADPLPIAGDLDGDGVVTLDDRDAWLSSYGGQPLPFAGADANGDGRVNAADYAVWRDAYSNGTSSIPEPSAWLLLGLATLATLRRK